MFDASISFREARGHVLASRKVQVLLTPDLKRQSLNFGP